MIRSYDNQHQANYQELSKVVDRLSRSVNTIKSNKKKVAAPSKYSGSGFMISNDGYIATSYHVVKTADSIVVENEKFGRLKTTFVYGDDTADIALLLITDDRFSKLSSLPYPIRMTEGSIGENVYTLGFPREDIVYGEGSISATSGFQQNKYSYQVSIPANPGNSGGPMIDQNGAVIGIINGAQAETRGAAFAIKSDVLLKVISAMPQDSLTVPLKVPAKNQLAGLTRVSQIKKWKDYVFVVKVYHGK
jgi:S1-C subfamily serine protease